MTWIWLLVTSVSSVCEVSVDSYLDVQSLRAAQESEDGAQLAEVIAAAAMALEEYTPDTDKALLQVTARDGVQVPVGGLQIAGLLVVETTGELGFTVGRGMVLMMLEGELTQVVRANPADYSAAYQLPGFTYWKAVNK